MIITMVMVMVAKLFQIVKMVVRVIMGDWPGRLAVGAKLEMEVLNNSNSMVLIVLMQIVQMGPLKNRALCNNNLALTFP